MRDLTFTTSVSGQGQRGFELRGVPLAELVEEANFVKTLFLSLTGRFPKPAEEHLLNAVLVASIDHGIHPASGFVPRVVAASGNDFLPAMASTLLALGPYHGGALSAAMQVLQDLHELKTDKEVACVQLVREYRSRKQRVPGFGHAVYKDEDPRATQLLSLAQKGKLDRSYITLALMLEHALEQEMGRKLVLNIDGAAAAILITLGLEPKVGNALFGLARVAGSIAHIQEEQSGNTPVRRLAEQAVEYSRAELP